MMKMKGKYGKKFWMKIIREHCKLENSRNSNYNVSFWYQPCWLNNEKRDWDMVKMDINSWRVIHFSRESTGKKSKQSQSNNWLTFLRRKKCSSQSKVPKVIVHLSRQTFRRIEDYIFRSCREKNVLRKL